MPKLQNPPQGGEKYLCLTLFLTMMMAVVSAVAIIYSIVIIYVPAKTVLESNLQGPKKCTTITMDRDIDDPKPGGCENWTSCHEWCLSKVSFHKCWWAQIPFHFVRSKQYMKMRDVGTLTILLASLLNWYTRSASLHHVASGAHRCRKPRGGTNKCTASEGSLRTCCFIPYQGL